MSTSNNSALVPKTARRLDPATYGNPLFIREGNTSVEHEVFYRVLDIYYDTETQVLYAELLPYSPESYERSEAIGRSFMRAITKDDYYNNWDELEIVTLTFNESLT